MSDWTDAQTSVRCTGRAAATETWLPVPTGPCADEPLVVLLVCSSHRERSWADESWEVITLPLSSLAAV
ncbi:MAG: hypothetical protein EHM24_11245 [Acidobacteria bacterium]|nr:MAG: hypothetical protein EHM24_11245 [Acidobacteriota bacterium]